jgi:Predicted esterase of the alpha-beta hydrolase superfamily
MTKKILVVCSGGGARSIECHSGIIDAIRSFNIPVTHGRGSSGGAIVLGVEMSGKKMSEEMRKFKMSDLVTPNSYMSVLFGAPFYDNSKFAGMLYDKIGQTPIENLVVTMTNIKTKEAMYTQGNGRSVFCSTLTPEVFGSSRFAGKWTDRFGMEYSGENIEVVDGGVYDNIPVPNMREASQYWHIFILMCNNDTKSESEHAQTRIGRSLTWVGETLERQYRQIENDWQWLPNVTIIQPPPFRSSMLEFSPDYGLYVHAKTYAKEMLTQSQKHKLEYFRPE